MRGRIRRTKSAARISFDPVDPPAPRDGAPVDNRSTTRPMYQIRPISMAATTSDMIAVAAKSVLKGCE